METDREPTHPGDHLQDLIEINDKTISEVAKLLGVSRVTMHDLMAKRRGISPNIAARLGKLFGDGALFWLQQQARFDAYHAERTTDVSAIPTLRTTQKEHENGQ